MLKLNEVLKVSKTNRFPDYWTLLWGRKLSASMIKTLTGTLPLTFTAKGSTAADWVIYGNDDNGTENFVDISTSTLVPVNVQGTIRYGVIVPDIPAGEWTISMNMPLSNPYFLAKRVGSVYTYIGSTSGSFVSQTITLGEQCDLIIRTASPNKTTWETYLGVTPVNMMLVKGSTAPDHYIPYQKGVGEQRVDGYYVPLTISQQGQPDKTYDIYIGDSPLTEGETVSKTSTGQDIELFGGENTVSTTLYNKPEMMINYKE